LQIALYENVALKLNFSNVNQFKHKGVAQYVICSRKW